MNRVLVDDTTGQQYMLQPNPQDLEREVLAYDSALHGHLWTYVTVEGRRYTNIPELVNWDLDVDEWNESVMGKWLFGNPLPEEQRILREVDDCLDLLNSFLEIEEWVMDQVEAALEAQDDDDNDDDDDIDVESEDEGYSSDEERDSENDNENWIFGLSPMLMYIHL